MADGRSPPFQIPNAASGNGGHMPHLAPEPTVLDMEEGRDLDRAVELAEGIHRQVLTMLDRAAGIERKIDRSIEEAETASAPTAAVR